VVPDRDRGLRRNGASPPSGQRRSGWRAADRRLGRRDRERARRLARTDPRLAQEIGIGRPDRAGAADAELVDVNNASVTAPEWLAGVDRELVQRIVADREPVHGYTVEDQGTTMDLDGNLAEDLRERAVFLPRAAA
jgi:hypothetical protein